MSGSSLVPAIRVSDMTAAIEFYRDRLGFTVERGGPEDGNVALSFGDARLMLDSVPTDYYSASYNKAIAKRMGTVAPTAIYIESPDLDLHYERLQKGGSKSLTRLPTDHGASVNSRWRICMAIG